MSDTPLHEVETEYRRAVAGGRLRELDMTPLDRTGVPTISLTRTEGDRLNISTGYGESELQARIGAFGELAEGMFPDAAVVAADGRDGSYRELVREFGANGVADPLELVLEAGADYTPDAPLSWVAARRWRTSEQVWVPVEFAASKPAALAARGVTRHPLITPISNGLGAGLSDEQALAHGLLELLQRDGDTVSFRALDQGVVLDTESLADPALDALLARLDAAGIDVQVKVAADEFVPVLYCVGKDRDAESVAPIAMSAIGEAAHPDTATAARKAVLEFAASRARRIFAFDDLDRLRPHYPDYIAEVESAGMPGGQEPRALEEMRRWIGLDHAALREVLQPIFRRASTVTASGLSSASAPPDGGMLPLVLDRLAEFDVLVVDGADTGSAVRTLKVIVPRIEVETLSYGRIGERVAARLLDRGDDLVVRRDGAGSGDTAPVLLTDAATERLGGPVWLDRGRLADVLGSLYPLYREPSWHVAPLSLRG